MKRREYLRTDMFSYLPSHVIDNIMSCLPLRDAVRTSILSREWRDRWMSIPVLVFSHHFCPFSSNHRLERIIDQIFMHHQGSIDKFAIEVLTYACTPHLNHWILYLAKYKVQDFTLQLSSGNKYLLPSHFFAFKQLRHLNLYRCVFRPPPEFIGYGKLVTLDFQDVDFDPSVFRQFLSQSAMLERVRLVDCTDWDTLEIEGPSMRFFSFHGVFKSIRFKNCPVLTEVSLSTQVIVYMTIRQFPVNIKYFDFHPTIKKLHLHPHMLQFLGAACLPSQLPRILNNLKVLDLSMYLDTIAEVSCALCIMRSSPNLENLRITFYAFGTTKGFMEFIRAQEALGQYLNHLIRVEIALFSGQDCEVEFARYLLASAAALVEMVISPMVSSDNKLPGIINQLKHCPKASPGARVVSKK